MPDILSRFSPATQAWFRGAFPAPTAAQEGAWSVISSRSHALVVAPTGSGKTLSAFLWAIDRLAQSPPPDDPQHRTRVLYVSPLKALGVDVERNLRSPLVGVTQTALRLSAEGIGSPPTTVTVGVRSGDTSATERRALQKTPPDILITTPESLYLLLTSAARESLRGIETVIIDEIHAVASTKRGAHLAVSLERLDALLPTPMQRIGLSATVRPREEVARFLAGRSPVQIVAPTSEKRWELSVVVPVEDMSELGSAAPQEGSTVGAIGPHNGSLWPHVEESIVDQVLAHNSSIVFANSRRLAERLTSRFNEIWAERREAAAPIANEPVMSGAVPTAAVGTARRRPPAEVMGASGASGSSGESPPEAEPLLARAHHGSVSKEQRAIIEDDLKSGRLRCVVATSSLELGIDMGAVDLVVQVETPPSVASALQRVGRAGHQVGEVSRGSFYPKHRADLLHTAVTTERMRSGLIEAITVPANPLDILAQHTVAATALDVLDVDDWFDTVRRSAPFVSLPRSAYEATLDLLAGRYPSDRFAELRPRVVWDRDANTLTGRPGAQRLAVTSGGAIPDRGLFGVFMMGEPGATGNRVGELDEEMVYESRVGDVFALGATSWRIHEITYDRVIVTPAFGEPGRLPFWRGDSQGRPAELGEAIGVFTRELVSATAEAARERCTAAGLDEFATTNLLAFLDEQRLATGQIPDDRTLVLERFRDELGDWRLVLHSPYGMAVHSPWALAVGTRVHERHGVDAAAMASDDGIIVRIPDTESEPPGAELFVFEREELEQLVTSEVGGSALFASRFRECAARALLLPRYNPGTRSPLWQQRQRAAQLLDVARTYPTFPIILETVRECLHDVYDLPALLRLTARLGSRELRILDVETHTASPFARSLLFGYVAAFLYEGDSPLAERRAAALSVDAVLLGELLGRAELRELLDPAVLDQIERELQRVAPERRLRGIEGIADLLRLLGPLTLNELGERLVDGAVATEDIAQAAPLPLKTLELQLATLVRAKRVLPVTLAGDQRYAAMEDASRLRDALGAPLPVGVPVVFLEPVRDPLGDLVARYARCHGPFTAAAASDRLGIGVAVILDTLRRLAGERRVTEGEFRPHGVGTEWCDTEVLRRLRSRSLAALRKDVEPVDAAAYGRFLLSWQRVGGSLRGIDGVASVIDQLAGAPIPASAWESLILPARIRDYSPALLDELTATGEVLWAGVGSLPGADGWVSLHLADTAALTLPAAEAVPLGELQQELVGVLGSGGGYFFRQLADAVGSTDDATLLHALWELVWAGLVTNDTFAPLRALIGVTGGAHRRSRTPARARAPRGLRSARNAMATRTGPPTAGGRWSLVPLAESDPTIRAHALGESLLERYGILTRGSVQAEGVFGGFALAYKVLSGFEQQGRARRGYFIEKLGAAQFGTAGSVDRLRTFVSRDEMPERQRSAVALAATDPANPFGAALPWPQGTGHRPGRKAGALIALVDGTLAVYLERGGTTALTFTDDEGTLADAARALAQLVPSRRLDTLTVGKVDGVFALGTPFGDALVAAGFVPSPRGVRLRA
ncbi:ATP-dependent helicase [Rathayibacter toxicus]|uniref:DEAD/DEAH box helicase n=1 Tax=Rathayibacter toxicus TaxID=145458 RepID=A0A0C5BR70_9MICO|nr:ATP-dependent helicase [Rathayibacter toxicus]AJM77137.1 DEAD/DEAH box helicase [Rathayibacter toxicus]ALS57024.1 DEAD/DEAH box helicase [Rathayibacter toxicus]KKM46148.1 DEAD/DEAH box helicase [Rathayibacter toxicus]PPG23102.1 ATP-dependent helicase [Rathayibacter toxicus]PPG47685.1 ATP-dependent helicase [Rathayibacter toxicus]